LPTFICIFSFILEKDFSFCISKEKKTEKCKSTFGRYRRRQHPLKREILTTSRAIDEYFENGNYREIHEI